MDFIFSHLNLILYIIVFHISWIWISTEFLIDRTIVMLMPKYQKQPEVYYRSVLQSNSVNINRQVNHKDGS